MYVWEGRYIILLKGATSQVAGSPAILDQTVIVLDRTVITICGVLSFPSAWRWVRPSLVTSLCETHQRTGPPNSHLSQWWQICLQDLALRWFCFLGPGVAPLKIRAVRDTHYAVTISLVVGGVGVGREVGRWGRGGGWSLCLDAWTHYAPCTELIIVKMAWSPNLTGRVFVQIMHPYASKPCLTENSNKFGCFLYGLMKLERNPNCRFMNKTGMKMKPYSDQKSPSEQVTNANNDEND